MNTKKSLLIGLFCASLTTTVQAVTLDMEPGLWEHKFTISSDDNALQKQMEEVQKQLASMPPAQRKMMEDIMASQGIGISANGASVKLCMTREQIERGQLPQQDKNCTQEVTENGKGNYSMNFSCSGSPAMSGTGSMRFSDRKNYTGETVLTETGEGQSRVMTMSQVGTWLSGDCGNIKPIQ
jgi:hypothetical protein